MKRVKLIATACATAMLAVLTLNAQDFNTNERTFLTFSNTVELPGVTLQPGTYLFKLADSQSNRHIIQVLSQDEKQIHATILAVPAERLEVTGENVVTFRENAEGTTPAVQYWYYPGDRIGHEFVYPKDQAMKIAARTGQNVLSTEGEVSSSDSRVSSMSPAGEATEWNREGAATASAAGSQGAVQGTTGVSEMPSSQQEQQTAQAQPEATQPEATQAQSSESVNPQSETPDRQQAETTPAESASASAQTTPSQSAEATPSATTQSAQSDARGHSGVMSESQDRAVGTSGQAGDTSAANRGNELPRTASPLPLSGLIGLLSLGGAFGLRRARQ